MSITVDHITFRYSKANTIILDNFSATFEKGKVSAITGPNGCGKTTLTKLILGILKPEAGEIFIDGENIVKMSLAQVGRKVGYVMQRPENQMFCTSVKEEMEYGLKNLDLPEEQVQQRRDYYLKYFGLEGYLERFPFFLSQGEKQRLMLACVLAMQPTYLLLDEPTAALDIYRQNELGNYLRKICEETGCGIVFVSHDDDFIDKFAESRLELEARCYGKYE